MLRDPNAFHWHRIRLCDFDEHWTVIYVIRPDQKMRRQTLIPCRNANKLDRVAKCHILRMNCVYFGAHVCMYMCVCVWNCLFQSKLFQRPPPKCSDIDYHIFAWLLVLLRWKVVFGKTNKEDRSEAIKFNKMTNL